MGLILRLGGVYETRGDSPPQDLPSDPENEYCLHFPGCCQSFIQRLEILASGKLICC